MRSHTCWWASAYSRTTYSQSVGGEVICARDCSYCHTYPAAVHMHCSHTARGLMQSTAKTILCAVVCLRAVAASMAVMLHCSSTVQGWWFNNIMLQRVQRQDPTRELSNVLKFL
eukprot:GHUV01042834.1.p2 GENE.GHUV01042834.1~~GHUV01042834.1.p2  ORF type:complete len:114 (-),score=18.24 GHUV01042834.1:716-1057(-)